MSVTAVRRFVITCDGCGTTVDDPDTDNAMTARVAAGMKGWRFLAASGGRGVRGQRYWDFCPACEPKIPDA